MEDLEDDEAPGWWHRVLFFDSAPLRWTIRLLISANLLLPGLNYADDHSYPMSSLVLTLLGFWLWQVKLSWLSIFPLLLGFWINGQHLGMPYGH